MSCIKNQAIFNIFNIIYFSEDRTKITTRPQLSSLSSLFFIILLYCIAGYFFRCTSDFGKKLKKYIKIY